MLSISKVNFDNLSILALNRFELIKARIELMKKAASIYQDLDLETWDFFISVKMIEDSEKQG